MPIGSDCLFVLLLFLFSLPFQLFRWSIECCSTGRIHNASTKTQTKKQKKNCRAYTCVFGITIYKCAYHFSLSLSLLLLLLVLLLRLLCIMRLHEPTNDKLNILQISNAIQAIQIASRAIAAAKMFIPSIWPFECFDGSNLHTLPLTTLAAWKWNG